MSTTNPPSQGRLLYDDGVRLFLVLDFDGVLNVFSNKHTGHGGPVYGDIHKFDYREADQGQPEVLPITWSSSSPKVSARLRR